MSRLSLYRVVIRIVPLTEVVLILRLVLNCSFSRGLHRVRLALNELLQRFSEQIVNESHELITLLSDLSVFVIRLRILQDPVYLPVVVNDVLSLVSLKRVLDLVEHGFHFGESDFVQDAATFVVLEIFHSPDSGLVNK